MPRRIRASAIENRTARLKLVPRGTPYCFTVIARGLALGYRRNKHQGVWVIRAADGHGRYWTDVVGIADDHEAADGSSVLDFFQAQDRARALVRGKGSAGDRPATVAEALDLYERDLATRGGQALNARSIRNLLPSTLTAKPVGLLVSTELRHWRDGLLATRKPSSVSRYCKSFKAALNLVAAHDQRITNVAAWRLGLAGLPDSNVARRVGLSENDVRALVVAAYGIDRSLGLWLETLATTGARPSQVARLSVEDLQGGPAPRLLMPSSLKGRARKRSERRPVPIPSALAAKLSVGAAGAPDAPLLPKADGSRWRPFDHTRPFARVVQAAGLVGVTVYSLRHSSIIRSLVANVPIRIVASMHDTSVQIIESNYAKFISDHSDAVSRNALLDLSGN